MNVWMCIFLLMSLILNVLIFRAYLSLESRNRELEEVFKDLEKTFGSVDKLVNKHKKTFQKNRR